MSTDYKHDVWFRDRHYLIPNSWLQANLAYRRQAGDSDSIWDAIAEWADMQVAGGAHDGP